MLASSWMLWSHAALAYACDQISPSAGFDRAEYVFTGKVVRAATHTWLVEVDRVWKGEHRLPRIVRLMDVYTATEWEFFFELGQNYLFFAILTKGGREFYPQVCNWTRPLHSSRVLTKDNDSVWLEDFILRMYGPGKPPLGKLR